MLAASKWTAVLVVSCAATIACGPALARVKVYWGDVHGHTGLSDGKGTVEEYLIYARDVAKLDFVIVTDHDFGNTAPWRMPKEAWQSMQETVDAYTVPGRFVAIAGYEWTSQPKYWTDVGPDMQSERLFAGPPKYYNHKVVYFPSPEEYLFSAKDAAYMTPNLLAAAVRAVGGLIDNAHPSADLEGRDQFDYDPAYASVIVNTEIGADTVLYDGKTYETRAEQVVRDSLNRGGKTGFVKGTDTHEGHPEARTGVLATELTREAVFRALRHRRNYAITNARIGLDFSIDGHGMGEEIEVAGQPRLAVDATGTDEIAEVAIIRDGAVLTSRHPGASRATFTCVDDRFDGDSYYYVCVTQVDKDEHGNPSQAWSSPIWARAK